MLKQYILINMQIRKFNIRDASSTAEQDNFFTLISLYIISKKKPLFPMYKVYVYIRLPKDSRITTLRTSKLITISRHEELKFKIKIYSLRSREKLTLITCAPLAIQDNCGISKIHYIYRSVLHSDFISIGIYEDDLIEFTYVLQDTFTNPDNDNY